MIAGQIWLQVHAEDQYRGRVFGAFETCSAFIGLLGIKWMESGTQQLMSCPGLAHSRRGSCHLVPQ